MRVGVICLCCFTDRGRFCQYKINGAQLRNSVLAAIRVYSQWSAHDEELVPILGRKPYGS